MKRNTAGSLMLVVLFLGAADCKGDTAPSPSPNCSWNNQGDRVCEYPLQKGNQPASSITPTK